jgi:hypothetical protein
MLRHSDIPKGRTNNPKPTQAELDFLNRRSEIENALPNYMTTKQFLYWYHDIECYGLTHVMLKRVEANVWYQCRYRLSQFMHGDFYQLYKHHWVVRKYLDPQFIESENKPKEGPNT